MPVLDNSQWGFDSNCFVCEQRNERGLRIPFTHQPATDSVTADFTLDDAFAGAPQYAHGGVILAILDEAMAWATIAVARCLAMTRETSARFERPVLIGRYYRVEATIAGIDDAVVRTQAVVHDAKGRACVRAEAAFVALDEAQMERAIGGSPSGIAAAYIRGTT